MEDFGSYSKHIWRLVIARSGPKDVVLSSDMGFGSSFEGLMDTEFASNVIMDAFSIRFQRDSDFGHPSDVFARFFFAQDQ